MKFQKNRHTLHFQLQILGLCYRNAVYDSTIGRCLTTVYSLCSDVAVKLTAESLVLVFPHALQRTNSEELKVYLNMFLSVHMFHSNEFLIDSLYVPFAAALSKTLWEIILSICMQASLCSAYVRIVKSCPPCIWKLNCLLELLHLSEPCIQLTECFKAVTVALGPDFVRGETTKPGNHTFAASDRPVLGIHVGQKRHINDGSTYKRKRLKIGADTQQGIYLAPEIGDKTDGENADSLRGMIISTIESLKPPPGGPSLLRPEISVVALSMLANAFCFCPWTSKTLRLFDQMYTWIPWIAEQVTRNSTLPTLLLAFSFSDFLKDSYVG